MSRTSCQVEGRPFLRGFSGPEIRGCISLVARYNEPMNANDPTHVILDLMAASADSDKGRALASDLEDLLDNDDNDAVARVLAVTAMAVLADPTLVAVRLDEPHMAGVLERAASL
jgi:hypothetical protein